MDIKQYQIVIVRLAATGSNSLEKTIKCVVISPDEMNSYLRTITIAPLVSESAAYPTRPKIKQNNQTNRVVLDQLMTIEKEIVTEIIGDLSIPEIKKIKVVLKETYID